VNLPHDARFPYQITGEPLDTRGPEAAASPAHASGAESSTEEWCMKLLVKGKNVDVSQKVQSYAEKRLAKVSTWIDDDVTRLELELAEEKNPRVADCHVAEVTMWTKGPTLRAREAAHDVFASIDLVAEKLMRQVQKYHDKKVQYQHGGPHHNGNGRYKGALQENGRGSGSLPEDVLISTSTSEDGMAQAEEMAKIVKTKQFLLAPMSPEEASLQMDLVGHEFFVFVNSDNNSTCVLYKRADGDYGLIEPALSGVED
jgi:putative sigma-54 modulation protein